MKIIKNKKQSGIIFLELILAGFILGVFILAIALFMNKQQKMFKNKATAGYMSDILEAAASYTKDFYKDVREDAHVLNYAEITIPTLVSKGYLPPDFEGLQSPYKQELKTRALFINNQMHIIVLHPYTNSMSSSDASFIANKIENGNGGLYFAQGAPANPCGTTSCLQGFMGLWNFTVNPDFETAFTGNLPTGTNMTVAAYINLSSGQGPYLKRKKSWNDLSGNTLSSDLNIKTDTQSGSTAIFFNALTDGSGKFIDGSQLRFINNRLILSGTDSEYGDTVFSSEGGLTTGLFVEGQEAQPGRSCSYASGTLAISTYKEDNYIDTDGDGRLEDYDNDFMMCLNNIWQLLVKDAFVQSNTVLIGDEPSAYLYEDNLGHHISITDPGSFIGYFR